ncbi:hypothetical protein AgCh_017329 [Apium graveolens]
MNRFGDHVNFSSGPSSHSRSLLGNRIQGSIPQELANIATLQELFLEDNILEGPIPRNFGSLIGLRRFRIDGNDFSGKIPDFIGNWTNMTRLDLKGTGLEGPIPLSISRLRNLKELRISDRTGRNFTIPDLKDMQSLHVLDLSFNRLTGQIPDSMALLNDLNVERISKRKPDELVPSHELMRIPNGDAQSTEPLLLTPMGKDCLRIDLTAIHELLGKIGYKDDTGIANEETLNSKKQGDSTFCAKDFTNAIDYYTRYMDVGCLLDVGMVRCWLSENVIRFWL